jgi:uncharacterized protein (DUF58 family)
MLLGRGPQTVSRFTEALGSLASVCGLLLILMALQAAWSSAQSFLGQLALIVAGAYLGLWGFRSTKRLRRLIADRLGWSGRRRYRVKLTSEALVYMVILIVLFAGSMLGRSNMLRLVFCLLAGPFVLNGWVTVRILRRIEMCRSFPSRVMAGDTFNVDLSLTNNKRWFSSWMMEAQDRVRSESEELRVSVLFTRVPPRSERTGRYRLRLMNRGRFRFNEVRVSSRFPLGLMERAVVIDQPGELLVYPRLGQFLSHWEQKLFSTEEYVQTPASRRGAFDDEFHRLREYQPGDSTRSIHWRTSARANALMVRDFHQHRDRDLLIVLDLWEPSRSALAADPDLIERAVSLAATLCVRQCRQSLDSELWLGVHGRDPVRWNGNAGLDTIDAVLECLALAQPVASEFTGDLVQHWASLAPGNSRRIMVTTRTPNQVQSLLHAASAHGNDPGHREPFRVLTADAATVSGLMEWN